MSPMLKKRLIFGMLLVVALLGVAVVESHLSLLPAGLLLGLICLLIMAGVACEIATLLAQKGVVVSRAMLTLSAAVGLGAAWLAMRPATTGEPAAELILSLFAALLALAVLEQAIRRRAAGAMTACGASMLAMVYLGILPGFYLLIADAFNPWVMAGVVLVVKSCDVGAYAVGRLCGRHRLIAWLSPGKTWEGLLGGMVTAGLVAMLGLVLAEGSGVFATQLPLWFAFAAGMVLAVVGQAGDLLASLFKRDAGIKDSGESVPGFGGILDVVDSPILAAPVAWWILQFTVHGLPCGCW